MTKLEIKRKYIEGRSKYWKSDGSCFNWDKSFEKIMEYANSRNKESCWQKALEVLNLKGEEKLLDFGAAMCWTSYEFSKIGCDVVAIDFDMDDTIGLRAGKKIIENTGINFRIVAGDCEQMPFKDESFDIAFGSQVLHHAEDLNMMVSEAARVTRKSGIVIAVAESKRGLFQGEEAWRRQHPAVPFGVNEHAPTYFQYITAFKKAGLMDIDVYPCEGWESFEGRIKRADSFLGKCATYVFTKIPLGDKIIHKLYLIFHFSNITIIGKKKSKK